MSDFFVPGKKRNFLIILFVILGVYFALKYLSPLITPFLLAFLMVAFLYPRLDGIQRRLRVKKSLLTGGILILFFLLLAGLLWWLLGMLLKQCGSLLCNSQQIIGELELFLGNCCMTIEEKLGFDGIWIERFILDQVNIFIRNLEVQVMPRLMGDSIGYVKSIAEVVGFVVIIVISTLLLTKDYDKIISRIQGSEELGTIWDIGLKVVSYIKTFLKAQLAIMCIISLICAITLWALKIRNGLAVGIVTGFMDALPFIGTGIILIPLALFQFLNGHYTKAVICLILYGVCAFTRELLEPKLIGNKVGIWPIAILFSVYIGIKLFGLFGILKGPIGLVIVFETYRYLTEKTKEDGFGNEETAGVE